MLAQLALFLVSLLAAPGGFGAPAQPTTYRSPSGEWSLEVDPTDRYGEGAADYRVVKSGESVWSKRLPFTWDRACIDDRGYAAGSGRGFAADALTPGGSIVIAVLSPAGEVLCRRDWWIDSGTPVIGTITGLVPDHENCDVLFRISTAIPTRWGDWFEQWCLVDLDRLSFQILRPEERDDAPESLRSRLIDVLPIPGADLLAVTWDVTDVSESPQISDLSLTIVTRDGRRVAAQGFPSGFEGDISWSKVRQHGTLMPGEHDSTFSLWVPGQRMRFDLAVKALHGSQCLIEGLAREPFEPADEAKSAEPPSEAVELKLLERVQFRAPTSAAPGPIRDIEAFAIAGPGRLQFIRVEDRQRSQFASLLLDEQGNVLSEHSLQLLESERPGMPDWHALGDGRWLITPAGTWGVDAILADSQGNLARGQAPGFLSVKGACGTPDGGYVVLGDHAEIPGYMTLAGGMGLASFDRSGSRRWLANLEGRPDDVVRLDSADHVAASPTGVVAVADPWNDALGLFDSQGVVLERLKLSEPWQRDAIYVAHVEADGSDGFLVVENPDTPIVHRIGLDGRIRSSVVPHYSNGARHDLLPVNTVRAPDGTLWTTDRRVLLRLGEDGVADLTLGATDAVETLDDPRSSVIDPLGRVLMFDRSTRAVHAFDRTGARLFVAETLPQDFAGDLGEGDLVGSFDGRAFVQTQAFEEGWLGFDTGGTRLGPSNMGGRSELASLDSVGFTPTGTFWLHRTQDREFAVHSDEDGNELARIERRADRRWFEEFEALAVSPSGQIAVLEELAFSGGAAVSWFDARGQPLGQLEIPATHPGDSIAYGGAWIAVHSYRAQAIWLVQTAKPRLMRMDPPPGWIDAVGFSPDGRELWLVQPSERALLRYSLP